jgi:hypothetical protein
VGQKKIRVNNIMAFIAQTISDIMYRDSTYKLGEIVPDEKNKDTGLKSKLEKEGLEIYLNKNNSNYQVGYNLDKIKKMLSNGEKIDSIDYERYKTDIDNFLKQKNKQIVSYASDPVHNTIDFYSAAENIQSVYGKDAINLEQYNNLTREQQQYYEKNPFSDDYDETYLYIKSDYYKNYTRLQLYKLLKSGSSNEAIKLLNEDTDVLLTLNGRSSIEEKTGNTLLHIAVENGLIDVVKEMLDKGAKPNFPNKDRNTPLHIAAQKKSKEIINLLLGNGADKTIENNENKRPFKFVDKTTENDLFKLLRWGVKNGGKKSVKKNRRNKFNVKKNRRSKKNQRK